MNMKHFFRLCVSGLCLSALSACSTPTGPVLRSGNGANISPNARLYGDYLIGSYAALIGDSKTRSKNYARAFALEPKNDMLGHRALISSLLAGNNALTRTLAIELLNIDENDGFSRAILGVNNLANGDYDKAIIRLAPSVQENGFEYVIALLRGWAQMGKGDSEAALKAFSSFEKSPYYNVLGQLQTAQVYARTGETKKAKEYFAKVNGVGISVIETLLLEARFLAKNGEKKEALKILNRFADKNGGAVTGPVRDLITAIEAGGALGADLTPAQMASRSLSEPAFEFYARQHRYQTAQAFLRMALELDPDNHKALLFLGTVLESVKDIAGARAVFDQVPKTSSYWETAQLSSINILMAEGKNDEAIKMLKILHKQHPSKTTLSSLGRAYLILKDYENALPFYEKLIGQTSAEELLKNPNARYLRGICLEQLGRWEDSVADFEFVLKVDPDNADALNYLGYTWVDKGVNLTKAMNMIRKAVELKPKSGAIIDSLGWAHFKLGHYVHARKELEMAAKRSPASATIIDHLGDVYWKLGRTVEAKYQWERALTLDPTDTEIKLIKAKIKGGIGAAKKLK
ncbi:MAG: tetratricopeptide repeat protein [Robiginitomaculum sp.]